MTRKLTIKTKMPVDCPWLELVATTYFTLEAVSSFWDDGVFHVVRKNNSLAIPAHNIDFVSEATA